MNFGRMRCWLSDRRECPSYKPLARAWGSRASWYSNPVDLGPWQTVRDPPARRRGLLWCGQTAVAFALVACCLGGVSANVIGDPWWDEVAPATAEAEPKDAAAEPVLQARQRSVIQRREMALVVLRRELSVVRAACPSLSLEDRRAILTASLLAVEEVATSEPVAGQNQRVVGRPGVVVRVQVGGARVKQHDAARPVEEAVAKAVAEVAPAAEAESYRRELAARMNRRKAAAVAVLVEAVDQTAMLDDVQREALAAALNKNWQPFWEQSVTDAGRSRFTAARLPPGVAAVVADVLGQDAFNTWQERLRRLPGS